MTLSYVQCLTGIRMFSVPGVIFSAGVGNFLTACHILVGASFL